jgi:putative transposase
LPDIFNTDQGRQFTGQEWTGRLQTLGIAVSMDGKGRSMYNVFIERLWRNLKHEEIYLRGHNTLPELEAGLQAWFGRYNTRRPHQVLNRTRCQAHAEGLAAHKKQHRGALAKRVPHRPHGTIGRQESRSCADTFGPLDSGLRDGAEK